MMTLDYWIKGGRKPQNIDDYKSIVESLIAGSKVTFSDNIDEPVHRWIRFPAGFSADLVRKTFNIFNVRQDMVVLDPFTGSGTLNVEAKRRGIDSFGVEAHPLLVKIARMKTYWNLCVWSGWCTRRVFLGVLRARACRGGMRVVSGDTCRRPRRLRVGRRRSLYSRSCRECGAGMPATCTPPRLIHRHRRDRPRCHR